MWTTSQPRNSGSTWPTSQNSVRTRGWGNSPVSSSWTTSTTLGPSVKFSMASSASSTRNGKNRVSSAIHLLCYGEILWFVCDIFESFLDTSKYFSKNKRKFIVNAISYPFYLMAFAVREPLSWKYWPEITRNVMIMSLVLFLFPVPTSLEPWTKPHVPPQTFSSTTTSGGCSVPTTWSRWKDFWEGICDGSWWRQRSGLVSVTTT